MRFLFIHPNFPSQHGPMASALAADPRNQVVFLTENPNGQLDRVTKVLFKKARPARKETHHYIRGFEDSVLLGQAAFRAAIELKTQGFVPDVIFGHSGWGTTLYMKDVFPKAALICNFEWYYNAHGSDCDFDPAEPINPDDEARIRTKNAPILIDLASCDGGIAPTKWQRDQFPKVFHPLLEVLHEGIDTKYYVPAPGTKAVLPRVGLDLSAAREVVTFVGRGMEPYRGFPQFIEAIHQLLQMRPECHVVIVGEDRVAYGKQLADGKGYKKQMLEKFPLDPARTHFTGMLNYGEYRTILQASSAHVYLTRPFVLSWSFLEAMSAGCLLVASNTAPVLEAMEHEMNGLLVDFFDTSALAQQLDAVLQRPGDYEGIRRKARETAMLKYDRSDLFPRRVKYLLRHVV